MNPAAFIPVLIVALVFFFVLSISKMAMEHKERLEKQRASASDKSLTTSELRHMIETAVAERIAELEERVDELEALRETASEDPTAQGVRKEEPFLDLDEVQEPESPEVESPSQHRRTVHRRRSR